MLSFIEHLPTRTIFKLLIAWSALIVLNLVLIWAGLNPGTPRAFPISIFFGPTVHWFGLPYAALFLIVLILALRFRARLGLFQVWVVGLLLIVLGNLTQGGIDAAFYRPFYASDMQLYHDALTITEWRSWLGEFNANQPELLVHAKTHPPFAVLLHLFLLNLGNQHLGFLAFPFTLFSSLCIVFVWLIMQSLGLTRQQSSMLALLFSVIPAFNIYSVVSLDGVVATLSTMFLYGMIRIIKRGFDLLGIVLFLVGVLCTNLLTFGGTFLLATASIIAAWETIAKKRFGILIALSLSLLLGLALGALMWREFGYDHTKAFITASRIENPHGFRALHAPVEYIMTRLENLTEIALFLSFGTLGVIFHTHHRITQQNSYFDAVRPIFIASITVLFLIFMTGAYRTGETARACLFIYPYLLLPLSMVDENLLRSLIIVAGLQTIAMQALGGYFW